MAAANNNEADDAFTFGALSFSLIPICFTTLFVLVWAFDDIKIPKQPIEVHDPTGHAWVGTW